MPLVTVSTLPGLLTDDECATLGAYIQVLVANALDAPRDPGGTLFSSEVEVRFRDIGSRDVNSQPFMVEVVANDFPSRRTDLDYRTEIIRGGLEAYSLVPEFVKGENAGPKNRGFVWVMLVTASFKPL